MCNRRWIHGEIASGLEGKEKIEMGRREIQLCVEEILVAGVGKDRLGYAVVEAGHWRCLVATRRRRSKGDFDWFLAMRVGGARPFEAFVGALAIGWLRSRTFGLEETIDAMVAATFATKESFELVDTAEFNRRKQEYIDIDVASEVSMFPQTESGNEAEDEV